ncbi:phospholipase [Patescibacteria group bacterium]|nr:phospholipase [Patescibacteria group bacterium]
MKGMKYLLIALVVVLCTTFNLPALGEEAGTQKYKLAVSIPSETMLWGNGLPAPEDVWLDMIYRARDHIYLGHFYVTEKPGSRLTKVLKALDYVGRQGVPISLLIDKIMLARVDDEGGLEFLKQIPNLKWLVIDYDTIASGVHHTKYMVVDKREAYVGSQNFDWRSLEHNHELGVWTNDLNMVDDLEAIFLQDWQTQQRLDKGGSVQIFNDKPQKNCRAESHLASSPFQQNPLGVANSENELVCLIDSAEYDISIQVMQYGSHFRDDTPYCTIDQAIRRAAERGVLVRLMVADWSTREPSNYGLYDLSTLPNVWVMVVTIPQASTGFVPFSRVIHSKYMVVDGKTLWVETGNWTGNYFVKCRNVALWLEESKLTEQAQELFNDLWYSAYAEPVQPMCYPPVKRN